jgi:hypothetical protein
MELFLYDVIINILIYITQKIEINQMNHNTKNEFLNNCNHEGEVIIKGARGTKVKVFFQGLHLTHDIFSLVYNLKFCILDAPFNTTF